VVDASDSESHDDHGPGTRRDGGAQENQEETNPLGVPGESIGPVDGRAPGGRPPESAQGHKDKGVSWGVEAKADEKNGCPMGEGNEEREGYKGDGNDLTEPKDGLLGGGQGRLGICEEPSPVFLGVSPEGEQKAEGIRTQEKPAIGDLQLEMR